MSVFYGIKGITRYKSLEFMKYPDYCVGDDGSVWKWKQGVGKRTKVRNGWRKKKPTASSGRILVNLSNVRGRGKTFSVHRLVLFAFVGPCPEGMECCHNDGNFKNNYIKNLR